MEFSFIKILYILLGLVFVIFNKQIGEQFYKISLLLTDKLNLSDYFIFRVDKKNKDSFYFLTRSFSFLFGLSLVFVSFIVL